jgi:hypothetical protein
LLASISVVADYTNNELIPKGVYLEKHVQWLQCIMSKWRTGNGDQRG